MWRRSLGLLLVCAVTLAPGGARAAGGGGSGPGVPARLLPAGLGRSARAEIEALAGLAADPAGRAAARAVARAAVPSLAVAGRLPFPDFAAAPWAGVAVAAARAAGLIRPGAPFRPDAPVSPDAWSAVLKRALGQAPAGGVGGPPVAGAMRRGPAVDELVAAFGMAVAARRLERARIPLPGGGGLTPGQHGALGLAVRLGIVKGLGALGLGAAQPLTRAEMAVLLVRTLVLKRMAEEALRLLPALLRPGTRPQAVPAALAPVELLVRNTPQLGGVARRLPPELPLRRLVGPTPGDPGETGALYEPRGAGPWPGVVFVNGVVARGWANPDVAEAARSLAGLGLEVYVPNLPGLRRERLTQAMLPALERDVRRFARFRDVEGGGVALFGVSLGASLALVAAARPGLRHVVRGVIGVAPYARVRDLLEATTTHVAPGVRHRRSAFEPVPWNRWVLARSLAGTVRDRAARRLLVGRLGTSPSAHPLRPFRDSPPPAGLSRAARAWWRLLGNRRASRFGPLYAALPRRVRRTLQALSPASVIRDVAVPVLLAAPFQDTAFPPAESVLLARLAPARVDLVRTTALEHAYPRIGGSIVGYWRFWRFAERAMALIR